MGLFTDTRHDTIVMAGVLAGLPSLYLGRKCGMLWGLIRPTIFSFVSLIMCLLCNSSTSNPMFPFFA